LPESAESQPLEGVAHGVREDDPVRGAEALCVTASKAVLASEAIGKGTSNLSESFLHLLGM